jgi:adenine-specific DNA-methyltransferase
MTKREKLELTWIGKDQIIKIEPRILIEDSEFSYYAKKRHSDEDIFDNKIIFGDNLLALKSLEQEYLGKIKCIYIDPPYNTKTAISAHYDDNLEHSIWLSLIKVRIELLWKLLRDDGFLAVQIDDHEFARLYLLMIEICGERNIKTIAVKMSEPTGLKMASVLKSGSIPKLKEFIILAGKSGIRNLNIVKVAKDSWDSEYKTLIINKTKEEINIVKEIIDNEKRSEKDLASANDILKNIKTIPIQDYFRVNLIPTDQKDNFCYDNAWRIIRIASVTGSAKKIADQYSKIHKEASYFLITTPQSKSYIIKNGYDINMNEPRIKLLFADDYLTVHPGDFWQDIKTTGLDNEGGVDFKNGKKPEALLKRIIEMCTKKGDIVLDTFAGSGSTGAVAHKMKRRWIMVEMGEHCHSHIIPRLKNVIDGNDISGVTKSLNWQGGGGFRYYKMAPSLITKDKWHNWIINKKYDSNMLAAAVCKLEGFTYSPSKTNWWSHGYGTESDFIYITTQTLTEEQLVALSEEVNKNRTLLIYCSAFKLNKNILNEQLTNLTLKKIPNSLLSKCEWEKDDYKLNISNLPIIEFEENTGLVSKKNNPKKEYDLFSKNDKED